MTGELLDNPGCKIADITIQLNAEILAKFTDKVFSAFLKSGDSDLVKSMVKLWESTVTMLKVQLRAFLPQVNFFLLKLLDLVKIKKIKVDLKKMVRAFTDLAVTKMPHAKVFTAAVVKKLDALPELQTRLDTAVSQTPLEHLCLRKLLPKPLFLYEPKIEQEFLMRVKKEMDEKTLKKKLKQATKEVAKELGKDTKVIQ